jgi:hypothetical protein
MVSPAKAHFLRASAAALGVATAAAAPVPASSASQYELMLAKLAEDRRRLKDVQSIERKAQVKRQLLPEYAPWIQGVLRADAGGQDDVFVTIMVWCIDIGEIEGALPLARYAIKHRLSMPDQYKRTTACLIAEEAADVALSGGKTPASVLNDIAELTSSEDMPDEVRAKLHKAIGYALRDQAGDDPAGFGLGLLEGAREHLKRALNLHGKSGVKKDIERLDTLIKNSATAPKGDG